MISQILPKSDKYFDNLHILDRIGLVKEGPVDPESNDFFKEKGTDVDENYFNLNWPPPFFNSGFGSTTGTTGDGSVEEEDDKVEGEDENSAALRRVLEDWTELADEVTNQTQDIVQRSKTTLVGVIYGFVSLMSFYFVWYTGMIKIGGKGQGSAAGAGAEEQNLASEEESCSWWPLKSFIKFPNFWN